MPILNNQCCHFVKLYAAGKLISPGGNLESITDTGSGSVKGNFFIEANKKFCV